MFEFSFELAFIVGAIAFYAYDCLLLLYGNELVCVRRGRRWFANTGGELTMFGKRVILPAPFTPWALLFRGVWSENDARDAGPEDWPPPALVRALRPLQVVCSALLVLLLVVLPAVALGFGAGLALLVVLAAFYLLDFVAITWVFARRTALGLDGKALVSLLIDALACPPFAINLVRKVTLRLPVPGNPLAFAARHFAPAEARRLNAQVRARVDEFLAIEQPDSPRRGQLQALRATLAQGEPS